MEIIDTVMAEYGLPLLPKDATVGMAYVPFQQFNSKLYSPAQALESGTAYPILDKPFYGSRCFGGKND